MSNEEPNKSFLNYLMYYNLFLQLGVLLSQMARGEFLIFFAKLYLP